MIEKLKRFTRMFYMVLATVNIGVALVGLNMYMPGIALGDLTLRKMAELMALVFAIAWVFYAIFLGIGIIPGKHDDQRLLMSYGLLALPGGLLGMYFLGWIRMDLAARYVAAVLFLVGFGAMFGVRPNQKKESDDEAEA